MYNDRKEMFTLKNIILIGLTIIIVVIFGSWLLFPKGDSAKKIEVNNEALAKFEENTLKIKKAATKYFDEKDLPKLPGDSKTVTVKTLLDNALLYSLADSNSDTCDFEKSKVVVTNLGEEYEMNVFVSCPDYNNYKNYTLENGNNVSLVEEETEIEENDEEEAKTEVKVEEKKEETKTEVKVEEKKEETKIEVKVEEKKEETKTEVKEEVSIPSYKVTSAADFVAKANNIYGSNNGNLTREEFVSALVILYESEKGLVTNYSKAFNDTNNSYINKAAKAGIVTGDGNGAFSPKRAITREEAAIMITNLFAKINPSKIVKFDHLSTYQDRDQISSWALAYVNNVVGLGIMNGVSATNDIFAPKNNVTKGHADLILQRTYIILK